MGEIYEVKCSCGYNARLHLGAGMNACNINFAKKLLEKSGDDIFAKAYENGVVKKFELVNVAYVCNECKSIGSVFQLTYQMNTGKDVTVYGKCNNCDSPVQILPSRDFICMKCNKKPEVSLIGHWD